LQGSANKAFLQREILKFWKIRRIHTENPIHTLLFILGCGKPQQTKAPECLIKQQLLLLLGYSFCYLLRLYLVSHFTAYSGGCAA